MLPPASRSPVVLCVSGHDPSGGAGIQADIEAILAQGAWPVSVVTALTAQNTREFFGCTAVDAQALARQIALLFDDFSIAACKIGLLPSAAVIDAVARLLHGRPDLPVVLDPVLATGTGTRIGDRETLLALRQLLRHVTVATPNSLEVRQIAEGARELDTAARWLLDAGCRAVLVTGTHERTSDVVNSLYEPAGSQSFCWPRLPHQYHGSGCTLAAALAARLALGDSLHAAVAVAQDYTWQTLRHARQLGHGQWHPTRLYGWQRST